ncbi:hypothetical protein [Aeromicrobium duanguangcaii]|uniref:YtxH domain-containing protein n=1 Tax=Aeromicrobium duanguangcaii TaxID=2968086 RepID=A0ABY5KDN3_9ACTN|nr:hypothetical protein [Aeromicrobium duanguangcaii]MCD9154368.1 hypothetical protein [Aeromicrobium duanguangcaii]UUI68566.1 hypothetical protein NP095_00170 [Aeromicrobium duanguangcaii]
MKKLALLTAVGVGYVLGTRAGRGRYEQIKQQAEKVWNTEPVQATAHKAQDTAKTTASDVGHRAAETAKDVTSTVTEKVKTAADFSKDDSSSTSASQSAAAADADAADAAAPAYSTSSEGLRADAAEADAAAAFDIDEAGSDDLAAQPYPLGADKTTDEPRA